MGVIVGGLVRVASRSRVRALEGPDEIPNLCEFFSGGIVSILLPVLLYLWIESILSASTVYFLSHRSEIVDPAF